MAPAGDDVLFEIGNQMLMARMAFAGGKILFLLDIPAEAGIQGC
jgi:hypothetical protein